MAIASEDEMKSATDQYNDSFAEDAAKTPEQSDDEAFGITPPAEAVEAAKADEAEKPVEATAEVPELVAAPAEAATEIDQKAAPADESSDEPTDPKEIQRKASWEGRLRKMEADLKAKAASLEPAAVEALEDVSTKAEDQGNEALGEAAEKVAEQVEDGSMTAAQAMKQLADDFGEEFVKMIEVIASAKASEVGGQAVTSLKGEVADIVSHIADSNERAHFEKIATACPDFNDVRQSQEFKDYVQNGGDDLQRIAAGGGADEVIKLLKDFKASTTPEPEAESTEDAPSDAGQADPEGADAAAGVRSGGLRLPDEPVDSGDYEGAFEEASKSK